MAMTQEQKDRAKASAAARQLVRQEHRRASIEQGVFKPLRPDIHGRSRVPDYLVQKVEVPNPPTAKGGRQTGSRMVHIIPEPQSQAGACTVAESPQNKGRHQLRSCHLELVLVGKKLSKKLGVGTGPHLRACTGWGKPGIMMPVRDHVEAQRVSKKFCACRSGGASAADCAGKKKRER